MRPEPWPTVERADDDAPVEVTIGALEGHVTLPPRWSDVCDRERSGRSVRVRVHVVERPSD